MQMRVPRKKQKVTLQLELNDLLHESKELIQSGRKTQSEIAALSTDESMSPIERCLFMLNSDNVAQIVCGIEQLEQLTCAGNLDVFDLGIAHVSKSLLSMSEECLEGVCHAIDAILHADVLDIPRIENKIVPIVAKMISIDSEDYELLFEAGDWLGVFLTLVKKVSVQNATTKLWSFLKKKDHLKQMETLYDLALQLSQDTSAAVRQRMCMQLPAIIKAEDDHEHCITLLEEIEQLLADEEVEVRKMAVQSLIECIPHLKQDTVYERIVPLITKSLSQVDKRLVVSWATYSGALCVNLKDVLPHLEEVRSLILHFYAGLCHTSQPTNARRKCAFNYPAVLLGLSDIKKISSSSSELKNCSPTTTSCLPPVFIHSLKQVLEELVRDEDELVRVSIAAGLHEVVTILGTRSLDVLIPALRVLLQDESVLVQRVLSAKFGTMMELYVSDDAKHLQNEVTEVLQNVSAFLISATNTHNWRAKLQMYQQLTVCFRTLIRPVIQTSFSTSTSSSVLSGGQFFLTPTGHVSPPTVERALSAHSKARTALAHLGNKQKLSRSQVYQGFVRQLFYTLHNDSIVVKRAAMHVLILLMRHDPLSAHRWELTQKVLKEFAQAKGYSDRLFFVEMSETCLTYFSRRWFKRYLFQTILAMAQDPVSSVRLRMCVFMPKLKALIDFPQNQNWLEQLEKSVLALKKDSDPRVVAAITAEAVTLQLISPYDKTTHPVQYAFNDSEVDAKREAMEDALDVQEEEQVAAAHDAPSRKSSTNSKKGMIDRSKAMTPKGRTGKTTLFKKATTSGGATSASTTTTNNFRRKTTRSSSMDSKMDFRTSSSATSRYGIKVVPRTTKGKNQLPPRPTGKR